MKCSKCGQELSEGSVFCPNCGQKIEKNADFKGFDGKETVFNTENPKNDNSTVNATQSVNNDSNSGNEKYPKFTFMWAVVTCIKDKYLCFQGRACRSEYWYFFLFTCLVNVAFNILGLIFSGSMLITALSGLVSLALTLPGIGVAVRRLHDTNRSGVWVISPLILGVLCVIFILMGAAADSGLMATLALVCGLGFFLIGIVIFIFMILKGTQGPNKYGPDPVA